MDYIYKIKTKIGDITLGSDGIYLTGLWFDNQKYYGKNLTKEVEIKKLSIFNLTIKWINDYANGKNPKINIPIRLEGSNFQKDVWNILQTIPYGKVTTYGKIAKELEKKYKRKVSARAVGNAVGHNPISIIVPCHRVIGANGDLTGYAGGLDKKKLLLKLEKADIKKLYTTN